jgi:hypothetical protein
VETLAFLGLSLVISGGALWILGCLINLCNAGRPKEQPRNDKQYVVTAATSIDYKLNIEAQEWQKETKITLAPSRRLCEEAVKHLN